MSIRSFVSTIALAFLFALSISAYASTPTYDAIYVFGDSYCDVGNIFALSGGTRPAPPYYNGRFSNGPLWVEHVASSMNLSMAPALLGGTDYAFAGAEVVNPVPIPGTSSFIPNVPEQVGLYLQAHGGKADPKALYILEGGGNDIVDAILGGATGSPDNLGFQIALGLSQSELLLRRAGAKNFLIPNLFDVSLLPHAHANAPFAHQASLDANKWLNELLDVEQSIEGIRIRRLDVFSLLQSVASDATHYGFTDIVDPCINPVTNTVCADPDHTFFWDVNHPTEFGHAFFAVITEAALSHQSDQ